jgi:hypothetical protein
MHPPVFHSSSFQIQVWSLTAMATHAQVMLSLIIISRIPISVKCTGYELWPVPGPWHKLNRALYRPTAWNYWSRQQEPRNKINTDCPGNHCTVLEGCAFLTDRLCGLVARVPGYRSRDPGFDSRHYQIFLELVGLRRDPFILVSTTEKLLGRNSSGSGIENLEYGHGDPLPYSRYSSPQELALTSTTGGRSVGIVRSQTKDTVFGLVYFMLS